MPMLKIIGAVLTTNEKGELFVNCGIPAFMRDIWFPSRRWRGALDESKNGRQGREYDKSDNKKVEGPNLIAFGRSHDPGQEDDDGKLRYRHTHNAKRSNDEVPFETKKDVFLCQVVLMSP